jgi:TRAP-type C4-dicarboxylate transport system permease small subunit
MMNAGWRSLALQLSRWSSNINRGVEALLATLALGMALLTAIQVFFRYALNNSIFWSEEVGRMCLVWLSFLGATAAYRRGAHIGIGFVVARLPAGLQRALQVLVLVLSLTFFAVLTIAGGWFVWFAAGQKTPALGLPKSVPYLIMPLSGLVFLIHGFSQLLGLLMTQQNDRIHTQ